MFGNATSLRPAYKLSILYGSGTSLRSKLQFINNIASVACVRPHLNFVGAERGLANWPAMRPTGNLTRAKVNTMAITSP